jgi:hypothetical protein
MLSFAGVPLLLETAEHQTFVSNFHDIQSNIDTDNYGYSTGIKASSIPQLPTDGPISIGTLRWPTGASRCGVFHGLIDGARLAEIRTAVGSTTQYGDLVMSDGDYGGQITARMRMLPPKVIHDVGNDNEEQKLYLITLVDKRFDWRLKAGTITAVPATWNELFSTIGSILGTSITVETVNSAYLTPSDRWIQYYRPMPTTLDAAATAVGQVVTVALDGTTRTIGYANSANEAALQWDAIKVTIGGQMTAQDLRRSVPASVTVVFGKKESGVLLDTPYSKEVTLASLAMSEYTGYTGISTNTKVLYADLYNDGTNNAACDAFATRLARDWYGWDLTNLDFTAPGIWNWEPTGSEECIEWHYNTDGRLLTRIILSPFFVQEVGNYNPLSGSNTSNILPPCKPVWYTEYHHLNPPLVQVGDKLKPGDVIGTLADLPLYGPGTAHVHFVLGDGSDILNTTNYLVVGQSLDISSWLPWESEGTRDPFADPPVYYPPVFEGTDDQEAARVFIQSTFATPIPGTSDYIQHYGSSQHKGGEYYAVDVERVDKASMAGEELVVAVGSAAVESTVIFAGLISTETQYMVIVRHQPCCCPSPWKEPVRCATTEAGDIETDFVVGEVVDGVTLELGDSILLKNQILYAGNYIGTVNTMGRPTLRKDFDTGEELLAATVKVLEGEVNANTIWTQQTTLDPMAPLVTGLVWAKVWPIEPFFAKLTTESSGYWKWIEQGLDDTSTWVDIGVESTVFSAVPSTIDGTNFSQEPTADMRVWMKESKSLDALGNKQYEFMPLPTVTVFKVTGAAGGGGYPATKQFFNGTTFEDTAVTTTQLIEVNGRTIPVNKYVIAFKTPGSTTSTKWMCQYTGANAIDVGCGLDVVDDTIVADFTDVVFDGIVWDNDACALSWLPGCGMQVAPDPVDGEDSFTVDLDALAGDRADTALVTHAIVSPAICPSLAVDLEEDTSSSFPADEITGFALVGGNLKLSYNRRTITIGYNEATLPISITIGTPTAYSKSIDPCLFEDCCEAETLTITGCSRTPSTGEAGVTEFSFDGGTAAGGVPPYTYVWDFDDGSFDTDLVTTYTYEEAGTYDPIITVTDACGRTATCSPGSITVTLPPTPEIECPDESTLAMPETLYVQFSDGDGGFETLDGVIVEVNWDGTKWVGTSVGFTQFDLICTDEATGTFEIELAGCINYNGGSGFPTSCCDPLFIATHIIPGVTGTCSGGTGSTTITVSSSSTVFECVDPCECEGATTALGTGCGDAPVLSLGTTYNFEIAASGFGTFTYNVDPTKTYKLVTSRTCTPSLSVSIYTGPTCTGSSLCGYAAEPNGCNPFAMPSLCGGGGEWLYFGVSGNAEGGCLTVTLTEAAC